MAADTTGWIGIGFSPNGGMEDADIAFAWFENNQIHLQVNFYTKTEKSMKIDAFMHLKAVILYTFMVLIHVLPPLRTCTR